MRYSRRCKAEPFRGSSCMRGDFIDVWSDTWREIWRPIAEAGSLSKDLFCELYRELSLVLRTRPSVSLLADTLDQPMQSRNAFLAVTADMLAGESALSAFFENAYELLDDLG